MKTRIYRSKDIQTIARITKIQLIHWSQTGAIIPYEDKRGRGNRRAYNWQNLIEASICRELNKFTIETHLMRYILDWLRGPAVIISDLESDKTLSFWEYIETESNPAFVYLLISGKNLKIDRSELTSISQRKQVKSFSEVTDKQFIKVLTDPYGEGPIIGVVGKKDISHYVTLFPSTIIVNLKKIIKEISGK